MSPPPNGDIVASQLSHRAGQGVSRQLSVAHVLVKYRDPRSNAVVG